MTENPISPVVAKKVRLPNSNPPIWLRMIVTIILMIIVFGISIAISLYAKEANSPPPSNYEECSVAKGSTIQESYPPVCVTKQGNSFIKELSEEELKRLNPQSESENNFCGGIAGISCPEGYICHLDGSYPDAGGKCIPN